MTNTFPQFGVKTAGIMVYAERKKEKKERRKGGKGGPKVTQFKYYQTACVELCEGPVFFHQIYFNEKLIWDAAAKGAGTADTVATSNDYITCKIKKGGLMRMYFGTESQPVDQVLQAKFGADAGAHRGMALIFVEKLPLEDWGNQFPNIRAVVTHRTIKTTRQICETLCRQSGLTDSEFDFSAISHNVRGLQIRETGAAKQTMEGLGVAFNFHFTEENGTVIGRPFGGNVYTIPSHDLGCTERDDEILDKVEIDVNDPREYPYRARFTFIDPARELEANEVHDLYPLAVGNGVSESNLPLTMTFQEAQAVCSRVLYRELYDKPETIRLSWEYLFLKIGDELILPGDAQRKRIIKIRGAAPGVLVLTLLPSFTDSTATSPVVQPGPVETVPGSPRPPAPTPSEPSLTDAVIIQLPQLNDTEPNKTGIYVGFAPTSTKDWIGGLLQINRGNGWDTLASSNSDAILGTAVNALSDFAGEDDNVNTLTVDLLPGNELESASPEMLAGGANSAVIGGEVIQFATADPVSGHENRWELSGLKRGQRRTENLKATHAAGDRFMVLDSTVEFVQMRPFDVDTDRPIRIVTYEQDPSTADPTTLTVRTGPTSPTAAGTNETSATLNWKSGSVPTAQSLKYRETGTETWTSVDLDPEDESKTLTTLTAGKTYEFQIEAVIEGQVWTTEIRRWTQWREIPAPDLTNIRARDLKSRFEPTAINGEIQFNNDGDVLMQEIEN